MESVKLLAVLLWILATSFQTSAYRLHSQNDPHRKYGSVSRLYKFLDSPDDPCIFHYCERGYECVARSGTATCICRKSCKLRTNCICGSDGNWYKSLCEMYRTACLNSTIIVRIEDDYCKQNGVSRRCASPTGNISDIVDNNLDRFDLENNKQQLEQLNYNYSELVTKINQVTVSEIPKEASFDIQRQHCTIDAFELMKENVLRYEQEELAYRSGNNDDSKDNTVSIMFIRYDFNNDEFLTMKELHKATKSFATFFNANCTLLELLRYDDLNHDGLISQNEFYTAFNKLYSVYVVSLDKDLQINRIEASIGQNVEIKCDISGTPVPSIVWQRYNLDLQALNENEIRILSDGTLYLSNVQLQHAGNYSCHAGRNTDIVQTHMLIVFTLPKVRARPKLQSKRPGENVTLLCHATGEPIPQINWFRIDGTLNNVDEHQARHEIISNEPSLAITNLNYNDTGIYICEAKNLGGVTRTNSILFVQELLDIGSSSNEDTRIFLFFEWGIGIYNANTCHLYHQIQSTDIILGSKNYVCGDKCIWGDAIAVGKRFIYASQPENSRLIIISIVQMIVVDIVETDKHPVELKYVPLLDQVWIVHWSSWNTTTQLFKSMQVIRQASCKQKHYTVHPIIPHLFNSDFEDDQLENVFIPSTYEAVDKFTINYAYVSYSKQPMHLYKLDLANLRYIQKVDLSAFNCIPSKLQFSAIYGFVFMQCNEHVTNEPIGLLTMDYLTDAILWFKPNLLGTPFISPDSRKLVLLNKTDKGATIIIHDITVNGLRFLFDVKTTLNISDITFHPNLYTNSYDLYSTATDKGDILFLNTINGKVEIVTGIEKSKESFKHLMDWTNIPKHFTYSDFFGHYVTVLRHESLLLLNGLLRTVECKIDMPSTLHILVSINL